MNLILIRNLKNDIYKCSLFHDLPSLILVACLILIGALILSLTQVIIEEEISRRGLNDQRTKNYCPR